LVEWLCIDLVSV